MNLRDRVFKGEVPDELDPLVERAVFEVNSVVSQGSSLKLGVRAIDPERIPVKTLVFKGQSPVLSGMTIRARIPRYDSQRRLVVAHNSYSEVCDYGTEESAVQIEFLSSGPEQNLTNVLRTDRSGDYDLCTMPRKLVDFS